MNSDLKALKKDKEFIKKFWVGLIDGDGSIQVNHWRKQSLQYRLVIRLSNLKSNYNILIIIKEVVGGSVRLTNKNKEVIWVVNKKEIVIDIIKIYEKYPPLTSKKTLQLKFIKECILKNSLDWYLSNRNNKYNNQNVFISIILNNNLLPDYFNEWFSGFVEAEGCFCIRKNNNHSFSISQKDDIFIINWIKQYFGIINIVRIPSSNFYILETYKKETIKTILNHFKNYPLLGEKAESLSKFKNYF